MSVQQFLSLKNDEIVKAGYLLKYFPKTKKIKKMYCVLTAADGQLSTCESESFKPKSVIDLSFAAICPVHESLFSRANGFQIIFHAFKCIDVNYYFADCTASYQEWYLALKPFCSSKLTCSPVQNSNVRRMQSLYLCISEAKRITLKTSTCSSPSAISFFCFVMFNNLKQAKTNICEALDPVWNEEFDFTDVPFDFTSIIVSLRSIRGKRIDQEVGKISIVFKDLTNGYLLDKWYPLFTDMNCHHEAGVVRLKLRYFNELVLPQYSYEELNFLLAVHANDIVPALLNSCVSDEYTWLIPAILRILSNTGVIVSFLCHICDTELQTCTESSILFRSNSFACIFMDYYMRLFVINLFKSDLENIINYLILHSDELVSVFDRSLNFSQNLVVLQDLINTVISTLLNSITHLLPSQLRFVFAYLHSSAAEKWPDDELIRKRVVTGFLFIRFICPNLLNLRSLRIRNSSLTHNQQRCITLFVKVLSSLTSMHHVTSKDACIERLESFIHSFRPKITDLVDATIAGPFDEIQLTSSAPPLQPHIDLSPDLALLHDFIIAHLTDLKKLIQNSHLFFTLERCANRINCLKFNGFSS